MSYPYPLREVIADGVVHVLGLFLALGAATVLILHVAQTEYATAIASVSVYGAFLFLSLTASAAFHLLPWERPRPWLHRIDHAAIYLKIAGTYTPLVVFIGNALAYVVLAGVWIIALIGAVVKLRVEFTEWRGSLPLYLGLGWASVLLIWPMWQSLPGTALACVAAGGLLYTSGTVIFCRPMAFQNAIWHGFVLGGSSCFFAAITLSLPAAAAN